VTVEPDNGRAHGIWSVEKLTAQILDVLQLGRPEMSAVQNPKRHADRMSAVYRAQLEELREAP
jgi:hypothetical protein